MCSGCILLQLAPELCFCATLCYLSFGSFFTKEKIAWFIFTLRISCNSAMFNVKDSFMAFCCEYSACQRFAVTGIAGASNGQYAMATVS